MDGGHPSGPLEAGRRAYWAGLGSLCFQYPTKPHRNLRRAHQGSKLKSGTQHPLSSASPFPSFLQNAHIRSVPSAHTWWAAILWPAQMPGRGLEVFLPSELGGEEKTSQTKCYETQSLVNRHTLGGPQGNTEVNSGPRGREQDRETTEQRCLRSQRVLKMQSGDVELGTASQMCRVLPHSLPGWRNHKWICWLRHWNDSGNVKWQVWENWKRIRWYGKEMEFGFDNWLNMERKGQGEVWAHYAVVACDVTAGCAHPLRERAQEEGYGRLNYRCRIWAAVGACILEDVPSSQLIYTNLEFGTVNPIHLWIALGHLLSSENILGKESQASLLICIVENKDSSRMEHAIGWQSFHIAVKDTGSSKAGEGTVRNRRGFKKVAKADQMFFAQPNCTD